MADYNVSLLKAADGNPMPQKYDPINNRMVPETVDVKVEYFRFQNAVTSSGIGEPFHVRDFRTINIEIHGNSTSRLVRFVGVQGSGIRRPIMGVRLSDLKLDSQTTGTGELWQLDLSGLNLLYIEVDEVAGGTVTVEGRAVV